MNELFAEPTLRLFSICAGILALKMLLIGTACGLLRVARGVYITPEDYTFMGKEPRPPDDTIERVRRAHHRADDEDRRLTAHGESQNRPGGDELDETAVERLPPVLRVVLAGHRPRDLEEPRAAQIQAAAEILGVASPVRKDEIDITDAHVGQGYGIPTEDSVNAVRLAARSEGLLFDPTYTGKAWAALSHAVRSGAIGRDATVVFMHTGGAPIVFTQAGVLAPSVPAPA